MFISLTHHLDILLLPLCCYTHFSYLCGCSVMSNFCDPMDWPLPGSSVHRILQGRILKWVAMPSSRGSSQPRDRTRVFCIADRFFTSWATRKPLMWPHTFLILPSFHLSLIGLSWLKDPHFWLSEVKLRSEGLFTGRPWKTGFLTGCHEPDPVPPTSGWASKKRQAGP